MGKQFTEIIVEGKLGADWTDWFSGLEIAHIPMDEHRTYTVLQGFLDQSALFGLLNTIQNLGLILVSINRRGANEI